MSARLRPTLALTLGLRDRVVYGMAMDGTPRVLTVTEVTPGYRGTETIRVEGLTDEHNDGHLFFSPTDTVQVLEEAPAVEPEFPLDPERFPVPCPHCKAGVGHPCITPRGYEFVIKSMHAARAGAMLGEGP